MTKITLIAHITSHADKADIVQTALKELAEHTRAEDGCMQFNVHRDQENQAHFMLIENWISRELWQIHMESQHLQNYLKNTDGLIDTQSFFEMPQIA